MQRDGTTVLAASSDTDHTIWCSWCRKQYADRHTELTCADIMRWQSIMTLWSQAVSTVVMDDDNMGTSCSTIFSICWREPTQIRTVFAGFKHSWLSGIAGWRSAQPVCNIGYTVVADASLTGALTCTWQSSACWCSCRPWWSMTVLMSCCSIKMTKHIITETTLCGILGL